MRNVYVGFRNGQGQRDGFGVMQVEDGPTYTGQWSHACMYVCLSEVRQMPNEFDQFDQVRTYNGN